MHHRRCKQAASGAQDQRVDREHEPDRRGRAASVYLDQHAAPEHDDDPCPACSLSVATAVAAATALRGAWSCSHGSGSSSVRGGHVLLSWRCGTRRYGLSLLLGPDDGERPRTSAARAATRPLVAHAPPPSHGPITASVVGRRPAAVLEAAPAVLVRPRPGACITPSSVRWLTTTTLLIEFSRKLVVSCS